MNLTTAQQKAIRCQLFPKIVLSSTMRTISYLVACFFCVGATAFIGSFSRIGDRAVGKLQMVDVEITFPGNKKVKAASGSLLKEG